MLTLNKTTMRRTQDPFAPVQTKPAEGSPRKPYRSRPPDQRGSSWDPIRQTWLINGKPCTYAELRRHLRELVAARTERNMLKWSEFHSKTEAQRDMERLAKTLADPKVRRDLRLRSQGKLPRFNMLPPEVRQQAVEKYEYFLRTKHAPRFGGYDKIPPVVKAGCASAVKNSFRSHEEKLTNYSRSTTSRRIRLRELPAWRAKKQSLREQVTQRRVRGPISQGGVGTRLQGV